MQNLMKNLNDSVKYVKKAIYLLYTGLYYHQSFHIFEVVLAWL